MKLNKLLYRFNEIAGSGDSRTQLIMIYTFSILSIIFLGIGTEITFSTDTASYLDAGTTIINGNIDQFRTPLYPLICYLPRLFNSPSAYFLIVLVQQLIFLLSVYAFYQTARIIIRSNKTVFFSTIFYACCPGIILWNQCILSESPAISGMVFFIYSLAKFIHRPTLKTALYSNLFLFLLIMLRPGFIYLIPVNLLFWGYLLLKKRNRITTAGISGALLVSALFTLYCIRFQKEYQLFSLSVVGMYNQYYLLRKADFINVNEIYTNNENLKKDLLKTLPDKEISVYDEEVKPLAGKYGYAAINDLVRNTIRKHSEEYLLMTAKRFHQINSFKIFNVYAEMDSQIVKAYAYGILFIFNLTFRIIYFFLTVYGICLICFSFKKKRIPALSAAMWIITACHLFSTIAGAQSEWSRLLVPCTPILILMACQCIDQFTIKKKKEAIFF